MRIADAVESKYRHIGRRRGRLARSVNDPRDSKTAGMRDRRLCLRPPIPVCTENSNSDIMVMQSAKDRVGMDTSSSLNWARERRPYLASDAFAIHYNRQHTRLEFGAGALGPV